MSSNSRFSCGCVSRALGISAALVVLLFVAGCGSSPAKPTVSIALSPAGPATLEQGGTASITAAVTNDTGSAGVTWSLYRQSCPAAVDYAGNPSGRQYWHAL
jgi:hypothetical protein